MNCPKHTTGAGPCYCPGSIYPPINMLRLPAVKAATGAGKTKIYDDIKNGLFPRPVMYGPRIATWPDVEVRAIVGARAAGKTAEELVSLVKQLEANRAALFGNVA